MEMRSRCGVGLFVVLFAGLAAGCSSEVVRTGEDGDAGTDAGDVGTGADTGAAPDSGGSDGATPTNVPGKHVHTLDLAGSKREYIVYVPTKAAGTTKVPVVFMFHGTSGDGEKFYQLSHWKETADAQGFVAVFPSALTYCLYEDENGDGDFTDPGERKVTTKWNAGKLGDPTVMPLCSASEVAALSPENRALADHPLQDDIAFVKAMLDHLATGYATDSKRIYASGFSNGAQMTSRLAVDLSDRFAAIAAHAGTMWLDPKPARPMTMVFTVGSLDDRFTPALGGAPIPVAESTASLPMFGRIHGAYLTQGQLEASYVYDSPRADIARWVYGKSKVGAKNRFVSAVLDKGTHEYPNGKNHPIIMADVLWEVFSKESLP